MSPGSPSESRFVPRHGICTCAHSPFRISRIHPMCPPVDNGIGEKGSQSTENEHEPGMILARMEPANTENQHRHANPNLQSIETQAPPYERSDSNHAY
ncbi:hypothetical protein BC936DRAFT_143836 [Jimgerdemannia flammicorona]|uniref:Uncharacterized protein n=1 Tax=Jimgerdemannia flammicorona TaxID=994334 RepID=A0A433DDD7_9FUNG|nr:hypothetical protein BC936DRAFT_143836 [Jimgerdemannia flammicorona]